MAFYPIMGVCEYVNTVSGGENIPLSDGTV